jgi:iron complex transport system ATP-binding protein
MAQTTPSTGGMTVHDLVALGRYPWLGALGRPGPIDRDHVERAIESTHLSSLSKRLVDTLSGGERQRAWLSMMLAQAPECLLLDEPIAALDVAHQLTVMRMVRRLSREHSLTVVIVLHDVNMAARFCDDIIALKGGRIVFEGSPSQVLQPQTLENIYGTRFVIARSDGEAGPVAVPIG